MPFEKGKIPDGASPFQPGQSGNPSGLPKGYIHSSTRLRRLLDLIQKKKNPVTGELEDFTVLEQMDMAIVAKAIKGNLAEYKEILDRLEGRAKQAVELSGEVNNRITIEDARNCEPLNISDESNPGIQSQPKSLPLPQLQGNS